MTKRILACLLAMAMTASLFAGCSSRKPAENNTPNAQQEEEVKEPALADVVKAVKDAYGDNYIPTAEITEQELTDVYGLTKDNIAEVIAEGPMMSTHVDRFIAVKAVDGKGEDVEKEMTAFMEKLKADTMMYPMNVARVQASQVVRHGDYVFFVLLGAFDETSTTDEEAQKFADEQVKIGIDAINSCF